MFRKISLAVLAVLGLLASAPAQAAYQFEDITCETTGTTGTGTVTLAGALTNYLPFATTITSGNSVPYSIVSGDGKVETGVGTFTSPSTLTRVADWSTDGAGAELSLSGTSTVCATLTTDTFTNFVATAGALQYDVGAADTSITRTAAGEAALEGDAIKHAGKQTIWVPAGAMYGDVTNPASCGDTYDSGTNDLTLKVCAFDTGATEERGDFAISFPKNWNEATTITAQFFWTNTGGASSSVAWEIGCVAVSDDDTLNATIGSTQIVTDAWIATNDLHVSAETSGITCAGTPAAGDEVFFRVNRDTSNGSDAMAGDAILTGVKLIFTDDAANDD